MLAKHLDVREIVVLTSVVGIDQFSKLVAQQRDQVIMNYGGVFGLFPSGWWIILLGIVLSFVVYEWWHTSGLQRWGMGFLMAGGLSNIIDRLLFGSVRDFIFYPWFGFYGNVADIVLGLGVGIVIISRIR